LILNYPEGKSSNEVNQQSFGALLPNLPEMDEGPRNKSKTIALSQQDPLPKKKKKKVKNPSMTSDAVM
jgi:hypothetical protein